MLSTLCSARWVGAANVELKHGLESDGLPALFRL